ncbi:MAG: hypothetical protein AB7O86_05880 [Porticoccaceae bacterium]
MLTYKEAAKAAQEYADELKKPIAVCVTGGGFMTAFVDWAVETASDRIAHVFEPTCW